MTLKNWQRSSPFSRTLAAIMVAVASPAAQAETPNNDPVIAAIQIERGAGEIVSLIEQAPSVWGVALTVRESVVRGTVILLHDLGGHADSPRVMASLRRQLHAAGWSTLSVTIPGLRERQLTGTAEELFKGTQAAIDAAVAKGRGQNQSTLILLGYGLGAVAASQYLANKANHGIAGLITIAVPVDNTPFPELFVLDYLKKITIPVLDIFGLNDDPRVVATAVERVQTSPSSLPLAATDNNKTQTLTRYRQVAILGADHDFTGMDTLLGKRIAAWLGRYFASSMTTRAPQ